MAPMQLARPATARAAARAEANAAAGAAAAREARTSIAGCRVMRLWVWRGWPHERWEKVCAHNGVHEVI